MSDHVGKRVSVKDSRGTIRYQGPVKGASGSWLGIEWDDAARGKHDGSKDGTRYFSCRFPTSGSFIRLSDHVNFGKSFLDALLHKYIEDLHGSTPEKVILGSSQGSIQVEAVNLDKIRTKLSDIHRLKEVSLDGEFVSAAASDPTEISKSCHNIVGLDLSKNLLPNWETIGLIAANLPSLRRLALNQNRITPIDMTQHAHSELLDHAFRNLQELQLNDTLIDWPQMQEITSFMPKLQSVELGYNLLSKLANRQRSNIESPPLRRCNLDSNQLTDWHNIVSRLHEYSILESLVLARNGLSTIPIWTNGLPQLGQLKHLSLSSNVLRVWGDIDRLQSWCPCLQSLSLVGNPLVIDPELARISRCFTVAKLPSLTSLDGTAISDSERSDCELYYLSSIRTSGIRSEEIEHHHPQWARLNAKHDLSIEMEPQPFVKPVHQKNTLRSSLFSQSMLASELPDTLTVYVSPTAVGLETIKFNDIIFRTQHDLTALPTMTLKAFKLKISKALRQLGVQGGIGSLWIRMSGDELAKLDDSKDAQDLSWLGIDQTSDIVVAIA